MSKVVSITLRRGMCFGPCPAYQVTLSADGSANWHGEAFVERMGNLEGRVDPAEFGRLAEAFERFGFFGWRDATEEPLTDVQQIALTVSRGAGSKTVRQHSSNDAADPWILATLVDGVAARVDWFVPGGGPFQPGT